MSVRISNWAGSGEARGFLKLPPSSECPCQRKCSDRVRLQAAANPGMDADAAAVNKRGGRSCPRGLRGALPCRLIHAAMKGMRIGIGEEPDVREDAPPPNPTQQSLNLGGAARAKKLSPSSGRRLLGRSGTGGREKYLTCPFFPPQMRSEKGTCPHARTPSRRALGRS